MEELREIPANRVQMRQLFQNLISNGLRYHAEQKPVVRLYSTGIGLANAEGSWNATEAASQPGANREKGRPLL